VHWHRLTGDEQRCLGTPHEWWDLGLGLALPSAQSVTDHANDASGHRERLSKKTQYGAYLFHALSCLVHSSVGRRVFGQLVAALGVGMPLEQDQGPGGIEYAAARSHSLRTKERAMDRIINLWSDVI
jgi:hypothetical protein